MDLGSISLVKDDRLPDSIAPPQQQQQQQQPVDCFPLSLVDVVIRALLDPVPYEQWGRRVPELASSKSTTVAIPEIMTSRSWLFGSPKAASYQSPGSDKFVSSGACRAVGVACEKIDVDSPASLVLVAGDDDVVAGTAGESLFGADTAGKSPFGSRDRSSSSVPLTGPRSGSPDRLCSDLFLLHCSHLCPRSLVRKRRPLVQVPPVRDN